MSAVDPQVEALLVKCKELEPVQVDALLLKVMEAFKIHHASWPKKKPKVQKKKKKKNKVCKSDIVIKVCPDPSYEEFDWKTIEADVRKIEIDGLMWADVFPLEDFVFGLKVLMVGAQIEDLMVPATDPVAKAVGAIKGVESSEIINIQTAQNDWGGKSSGKAPKKKKSKGGKKVEALLIGETELQAAADKFCMLARNSVVYVAGVPACDRSGAMDVTEAQLRDVAKRVTAKKPELLFGIIAAGKTKCSAFTYIPAAFAEKPGSDAVKMIEAGFAGEAKATGDKTSAFAEILCNADTGAFAIKEKDNVLTQLFAYIDSSGLCPDDSDSDCDDYIGLTSDDEE